MGQLRELLDADRATLFLVDAASGQLWSKIADGTSELRLPLGRGIAGHVASSGEVVCVKGTLQTSSLPFCRLSSLSTALH
jgi:hypothetical protein